MLPNTFTVAALALAGVASAQTFKFDNGQRICWGMAISCEYPKGRCAYACNNNGTPTNQCSCPDGQEDNPYTGAECIDLIKYAGRSKC